MSWIRRFITLNQRLCAKVEARLPERFTRHQYTTYKYEVARLIDARPGAMVLDLGGGKECPFLPFVERPEKCFVVSVDISAEELRGNRDVKHRVVADVSAPTLPFAPSSVDLIASRSVVEHLRDTAGFFANCRNLLRPGGCTVHTFPCRYSPFALLNRLLPDWVARRALYYFYPEWEEACGFPTHYDRCYYSAIMQIAENCGFKIVRIDMRYYQAIYYTFFFPLYLMMLTYDLTLYALDARNLACQMLLVTRPRSPSAE